MDERFGKDRGIKPGETQSVRSVLLSDEPYDEFMSRYGAFVTKVPPKTVGGALQDTITVPKERPA